MKTISEDTGSNINKFINTPVKLATLLLLSSLFFSCSKEEGGTYNKADTNPNAQYDNKEEGSEEDVLLEGINNLTDPSGKKINLKMLERNSQKPNSYIAEINNHNTILHFESKIIDDKKITLKLFTDGNEATFPTMNINLINNSITSHIVQSVTISDNIKKATYYYDKFYIFRKEDELYLMKNKDKDYEFKEDFFKLPMNDKGQYILDVPNVNSTIQTKIGTKIIDNDNIVLNFIGDDTITESIPLTEGSDTTFEHNVEIVNPNTGGKKTERYKLFIYRKGNFIHIMTNGIPKTNNIM